MHSMWKATRPLLALAAFFFAMTGALNAQTSGKIEGRVFDAATNQPLAGAQVVVVGTGLGNLTNRDGYYFINNVPAGVRDIRAQYIGYQTVTVTATRVLAGQTTRVDFRLPTQAVELEAITVQGEANPLVPRDKTISKAIVTGEVVDQLPIDNVRAAITLQPGVVETGDVRGQVIRGGRPGEASVYVDGVLVRNFNSGRQSLLNVGTNALEEVNVLTGGYGAEYGSAQSGIINYVTKTGTAKYSGAVNFGTDAFLPKEVSWGFSRLEASLGGPLLGEKLSFHLAGTAEGYEDAAPNFLNMKAADTIPVQTHYFVPTGREAYVDANGQPVLGSDGQPIQHTVFKEITGEGDRQPFSNQDAYTGTGTLHYTLGTNTRLSFGGSASRSQGMSFNSVRQFLPKTIEPFVNKSRLFRAGLDQILFQTAESQATIKVNVAYGLDTRKSGQRADTTSLVPEGPDFLGFKTSDYKFLFENRITVDKYLARLDSIRAGTAKTNKPLQLVESIGLTPAAATEQFDFDYGADNPYGILGYHYGKGLGGYFEDSEKTLTVDVDLDWQANRVHRFGAGFEMYKKTVENLDVCKLCATTFDDVYRVKPVIGAIWVKDRMDIGEMVLDFGIRYDQFDSDALYAELPGLNLPFSPASAAEEALCAAPPSGAANTCLPRSFEQEKVSSISPRLGVAFPVTESTNFRLSYGHFFQMPALQDLFGGLNTDLRNTNTNMPFGRPLKAMKAVQFEAGITHLFNASTVLDVTAYNKDKLADASFRIAKIEWPAALRGTQDARYLTNLDFGNSKGVDMRLTRRLAQSFTTIIGYSYLNARGTGGDPQSYIQSFGRYTDPVTGAPLTPAQALQYLEFDQRHKFTLAMTANFDENAANPLLRHTTIAIQSLAGSGLPYTRSSTPGASGRGASGARFIELLNASRMPWTFDADVKVTRGIKLGSNDISLFADVRNLLNTRNQTNVYGYTGSPTDPGNIETESAGSVGPNVTIANVANVQTRLQYERQQQILKLNGLADEDDNVLTSQEQKRARGLDFISASRIETFFGTPRRLRLGFEWMF